jgi:hydrogenase maturation factor
LSSFGSVIFWGLFEIARASNVGIEIDEAALIMPESVRMLYEAFSIDPLV